MPLIANIDVDYDFCLNSDMVAKDLLIWLDLDDTLDASTSELYSFDFFGRNMMLLDDFVLRISCPHKSFDRWANSEEMLFDISRRPEKRKFIEWVREQREILESKSK